MLSRLKFKMEKYYFVFSLVAFEMVLMSSLRTVLKILIKLHLKNCQH